MAGLKFIALSGTTDVTENLYVYEYGNDMIIVDCGIGFPEAEMYGVDLVIPDFSYIVKNKHKLRGILISHGHEDHLGALPFLLKDVQAPIYATKLVAGFIQDKFSDHKMKGVKINVIDPDKDTLSLGVFKIQMFRVSHSVPDGVGFAIDTPEGSIFHVADYKFDWTPVDGKPFDIARAATLASSGVLAVASDCLGATTPGYTQSEKEIETQVGQIARDVKGQIFFTTISSNISRMQQAINVAKMLNRKVVFVGRSTEAKAQIAKDLGYLHAPENLVVPFKKAGKISKQKIMYIISGSYGQPGSALYRVANAEHDFLSIGEGDAVIFSSDPAPPGSKANVDGVVDRLIEIGVDVHYYEMQEDLHVSGHGCREDIKMLFALLKPKYYIPIGGTIRHMREYKNIAISMGAASEATFELMPGDIIEFNNARGVRAGKIDVKSVLVDGLGVGDVGNVVLRDRKKLARDGVAIVLLQLDRLGNKLIASPEVISRGFVFEKQEKDFLAESANLLVRELEKKERLDRHVVRRITIDFLEKYFFRQTGRRPMILPVVVEA
ncbi:ribonuclease J [Patescibacteria group bacterium]|nr:ribonuclease J [Patescibacteria group bacterium]MBU0776772.1 ribonuclease J [Patescibacteria group bacterium]MBU0846345.1 ribonuclease J [Patescibacteria group bacterium]MBU0922695.1 ribonuclease J [Patescibacteria group bacterium]MBU1066746.1 ribonuclease J [Patescibacteria group bacterium]